MNIISRGVRGAFRNGVRATAILGMLGVSIGLALAMLLAHQAIGQKIVAVQKNIGNTVQISPAGIRGFAGGGTPLTTDQIKSVTSIAHVTSVDATLTDRLSSSDTNLQSSIQAGNFGRRQFRIDSGDGGENTPAFPGGGQGNGAFANFTPPIIVVGANNPLAGQTGANGGNLTLKSGQSFDGTADALVALVGTSLASKNNLSVGSTFTAYGQTVTVKGIFEAGNTFGDSQLLMPLPTVERLSQQAGDITGATARIDSATNLTSATNAIKAKLGTNADVTNEADAAKTTLDSLQSIQHVSVFSLVGAGIAAGAIILLTTIMIVRERRREIGVLKAIGGSDTSIMLQFAVESITLTVLAALVGIIIGSVTATPVTKLLANSSSNSTQNTTQFTARGGPGGFGGGGFRARLNNNSVARGLQNVKANVSGSIVLYGLASAVGIAIIGSVAAAGMITKIRPSEVMRTE